MAKLPKNSWWFSIGCGASSATLGILVGASQSPIAGAFVTAVFGLAVASLGVFDKRRISARLHELKKEFEAENPESRRRTKKQLAKALGEVSLLDFSDIGKLLVTFSAFFVLGLVGGAEIRASGWPQAHQESREFPWEQATAPAIPFNALDWVIIQEQLLEVGYSHEEVKELYKIQFKYWEDQGETIPSSSLVGSHEPLSQLLEKGLLQLGETGGKDSRSGLVAVEENKTGNQPIG